MCQQSKRFGKLKQAEVVHHVFPRELFPEYELELWNLISLTRAEHNKLHDRETDELTPEGIELLKRVARKNGIPVPDRYKGEANDGRGKGLARGVARFYGLV